MISNTWAGCRMELIGLSIVEVQLAPGMHLLREVFSLSQCSLTLAWVRRADIWARNAKFASSFDPK